MNGLSEIKRIELHFGIQAEEANTRCLFTIVPNRVPFGKQKYCYFSSSNFFTHLIAHLHNLPKMVKCSEVQDMFRLKNHFGTRKHTRQFQAEIYYILIKGYKKVVFSHQYNKVRSCIHQGILRDTLKYENGDGEIP